MAGSAGSEIIAEQAVTERPYPHLPGCLVVVKLMHIRAQPVYTVERLYAVRLQIHDVDAAILCGKPQSAGHRFGDAPDSLPAQRHRVIARSSPMETRIIAAKQIYAAEICTDPYVVVAVRHDAINSVIVELVVIDQILTHPDNLPGSRVYDIQPHFRAEPDAVAVVLGYSPHCAVGQNRHIIDSLISRLQINTHNPFPIAPYPHPARTVEKHRHYIIEPHQEIGIERRIKKSAALDSGIIPRQRLVGGNKHPVVGRHGQTDNIAFVLPGHPAERLGLTVEFTQV